MTLVYFVNWAIAAQGDDAWVLSTGWRYMLLSGALPAALFLLLLLLVPETPRWLVMKGRTEEAHDVLTRLTNDIEASTVLSGNSKASLAHDHGQAAVLRRTGAGRRHHAVGVPAVRRHQRGAVLRAADVPRTWARPLTRRSCRPSSSASRTSPSRIVALVTVDRWGRKPLLILGALVMAVSMLTLGFLFYTGNVGTPALIAAVAYIAGFALSWGPVVWVLLSEIFPNAIKSQAMAIAVAAQWIGELSCRSPSRCSMATPG